MDDSQVVKRAQQLGVKRVSKSRQSDYNYYLRNLQTMKRMFESNGLINWKQFIDTWSWAKRNGTRELRSAMNSLYDIVANLGGHRVPGNKIPPGYVKPAEARNHNRIRRLLGAAINILESQGPQ